LKTLNWLRPGTHWVLKSPNHCEQLSAIFDVFPDATIIQTHRTPMETMASCCSLMAHTQGLSTDRVDPEAIGQHWLKKVQRMSDRAMAARHDNPNRRVIDVFYEDLINAPGDVISQIYQHHGSPLTEAGCNAAIAAAKMRNSKSNKRHAYALADFGLTANDIEMALGDYIAKYQFQVRSGDI
ncbi:MAG: sulfotransferase, partial [Pseudomonadota bacterium]